MTVFSLGGLALSLMISSLQIGPAQAAKKQRLSSSVGRVQNHVVTSREVQINHLVEESLYRPKKNKAGFNRLAWGSKALLREATAVLLEWTVHLEAVSFSAAKTSQQEVGKAERTVLRRAAQSAQWKTLGVTQSELRTLLRRKLQAKKFIRFKVDSASVPITDSEAKEYFDNNRLQFGNLPFDNFKANIKAFLGRQQVDERLKDWFEVLQAKYNVRNFLAEPQ